MEVKWGKFLIWSQLLITSILNYYKKSLDPFSAFSAFSAFSTTFHFLCMLHVFVCFLLFVQFHEKIWYRRKTKTKRQNFKKHSLEDFCFRQSNTTACSPTSHGRCLFQETDEFDREFTTLDPDYEPEVIFGSSSEQSWLSS